jgi:hypothetical protein
VGAVAVLLVSPRTDVSLCSRNKAATGAPPEGGLQSMITSSTIPLRNLMIT